VLTIGDGFTVSDVRCPLGRSGFGGPEQTGCHVLGVVRRGAFVRRVEGQDVLLDCSTGYLAAPDEVARFAHPVDGGDECTAVRLQPGLLAALAGGDPQVSLPAVPMDAASELAMRRVLALAAQPDPDGALAEHLVRALAGLLARRLPERVASGRPATAAAHRRLVQTAWEAMQAEPVIGLIELSRRAGCSPHHLSRVFSRLTGSSVSRYRARLRVSLALERIAQGERDLAALSAELGFADHAHMTRTIRAQTGHPPAAVRGLLGAGKWPESARCPVSACGPVSARSPVPVSYPAPGR
jgi:AraC-like DNA-binding protein